MSGNVMFECPLCGEYVDHIWPTSTWIDNKKQEVFACEDCANRSKHKALRKNDKKEW